MTEPILTIGFPVFQGEKYISNAIESILAQDFTDWRLVLSDNASTDSTARIARSYTSRDRRISYTRHSSNIGAPANFLSLIPMAKSKYFMWAAADDAWSSNYFAACLHALSGDPRLGFCSGQFVNIDTEGIQLRRYSPIQGLDTSRMTERIARYAFEREADGKANLIYSVFKTDLIRSICAPNNILEGWGADMALVTAALARAPYRQVASATLYKRVTTVADVATSRTLAEGRYDEIDFAGNFPLRQFPSYMSGLLRGIPSLRARAILVGIMFARLIDVVGWRLGLAVRGR